MAELGKEGWYEDPAGRHEYRWFSVGVPTDLVKDAGKTSRDAISMTDAALYQSMQLAEPPDDRPLLHTDDAPQPKLDLVNIDGVGNMGYAAVINTAARGPYRDPAVWSKPAGPVEIILVLLPLVAAVVLFGRILARPAPEGIPLIVLPLLFVLSLLIAILGRWRRRLQVRRLQRR
jgi:hypothetical protein